MIIDKYLYFRTQADQDDDDGIDDSLYLPARQITALVPTSTTALTIFFESMYNNQGGSDNEVVISDKAVVRINTHTHQEVIDKIIRAMTSTLPLYGDGFIDVCDDVTTNTANETVSAVRISGNITGMGDTDITVAAKLT